MPAFLNWLSDHGVDTSAVTVEQFGDAGYGLKAVHDIKVCTIMCSIRYVFYFCMFNMTILP